MGARKTKVEFSRKKVCSLLPIISPLDGMIFVGERTMTMEIAEYVMILVAAVSLSPIWPWLSAPCQPRYCYGEDFVSTQLDILTRTT